MKLSLFENVKLSLSREGRFRLLSETYIFPSFAVTFLALWSLFHAQAGKGNDYNNFHVTKALVLQAFPKEISTERTHNCCLASSFEKT